MLLVSVKKKKLVIHKITNYSIQFKNLFYINFDKTNNYVSYTITNYRSIFTVTSHHMATKYFAVVAKPMPIFLIELLPIMGYY